MGLVYGLRGDSTHLYYASWNLYNNRRDISKVRKDGEGATTLAALDLEPRGLALDEQNVYYTSGIRLMRIAKAGGIAATPAPMFSSQSIALDETNVYGIPGDYGPYDRVVKIATKGGDTTELATADRPLQSHGPFGYSSIAVDASGIYVTDSSGNRVLRFALAGGKPKVLTARQAKPYDLAIDGSHVFFSLAEQNNLMMVPKAGGTATKLASGLISRARFATDETSIYTTFAGKDEQALAQLARLPRGEGERKALAPVPTSHTVEAIAVDANCVFWLQRDSGSGKSVLYALKK
jgi:hypothetical protein